MVRNNAIGNTFSSVTNGTSKFLRKALMTTVFLGSSMLGLKNDAHAATNPKSNIETNYEPRSESEASNVTRADLPKNVATSYIAAYTKSEMRRMVDKIQSPSKYDEFFAAAEKKYGVPALVIKTYCVNESFLVPHAQSPTGPRGIAQFTRGTARVAGLTVNDEVDERLNAGKSIMAIAGLMTSYLNEENGRFFSRGDKDGVFTLLHSRDAGGAWRQYEANAKALFEFVGLPMHMEKGTYAKVKATRAGFKVKKKAKNFSEEMLAVNIDSIKKDQPLKLDNLFVTAPPSLEMAKIEDGSSSTRHIRHAMAQAVLPSENFSDEDAITTGKMRSLEPPERDEDKPDVKPLDMSFPAVEEQFKLSAIDREVSPVDTAKPAFSDKQKNNLLKKLNGKTVRIGDQSFNITEAFSDNKDDVTQAKGNDLDALMNAFTETYGADKAAKYLNDKLNKQKHAQGDIVIDSRSRIAKNFAMNQNEITPAIIAPVVNTWVMPKNIPASQIVFA